jgi:glutamyl-tRNA reductase
MSVGPAQSLDFVCVGINHHRAPVDIRERVAFNDLDHALKSVLRYDHVQEAAILSTCNRVELYAHGDVLHTPHALESFLHEYHRLPRQTLTPHLYQFQGLEALKQLFRVTTSVDSLIVGEPQVLGQVKDAYTRAHEAGGVGPLLTRAFSQAFATAKRVRNETDIGRHAVTVSFAAVELAHKVFGDLKKLTCLLVGAGEMSELAAQHFAHKGAKINVVNRSLEQAHLLAQKYTGEAHSLSDLEVLLQKADVVLTSTAAPHFLVEPALMRRVMRARRHKPIFFVDIAVPRNVDPKISAIDSVYLYNIDDLSGVVAQNVKERLKEAQAAHAIIDEEIALFRARLNEQQVIPLILALKEKGALIAETELGKTLAQLGSGLSVEQQHQIELMARSIVNKLLHEPITELKAEAKDNPAEHLRLIELSKRLFGI